VKRLFERNFERKDRANGRLDREGRDNSGDGFDYKNVPDRSDLAEYIEKLTKATTGENVRG